MRAEAVPIHWHPGLSIFASESFLKGVGDEYGWIGGTDESGKLRCVLPYTIIHKAIFRMVRFRVETIPLRDGLSVDEEKSFLNSAVKYLRSIGGDVIIPATTNTIFRSYPDGAAVAPYGSYVIDLTQREEVLWRNIHKKTRQNINTAEKNGVSIREGFEQLEASHALIQETLKRTNLPFMELESLRRYVNGLGENGKLLIADYQGVLQSCVVYAFSDYCAYAVYGGNIDGQFEGANKFLHWEAIRLFKKLGVKCYDFVGARIDPEKGSKAEAINSFKRRLGGKLRQGYMWKCPLRSLKYRLYNLGARLRSGGDIVDAERHKMKSFSASAVAKSPVSEE